MTRLVIRPATSADADTVHGFIVELAVYENEPDAVEATPASIRAQLESPAPPFECLLGEADGVAVGFALFFRSYSTWTGRPGLYLEDLFVQPQHRGHGYGLDLLAHVASLAVERGFARVDWQVLDWNTPSIEFYEHLGAAVRRDWLPCRLSGDALVSVANRRR